MKIFKPYIILIIVLVSLMILFFVDYRDDLFIIDHPHAMNEDWTFENEPIIIPIDLNITKNTPYTIETVLTEDFHEPKFIMIRSSLQNITIALDDVVIYQKIYGESLLTPYASMWHIVEMPRHIDGQTLTITFSSPYTVMSGQINEIFYGSEVMHYTYLIRTYGMRLMISMLVFVIGLIVMISDSFFTKNLNRGFSHAGLFAILLSLWMFSESRMMQFFTGSELLIGSLAYLTLPLFPIPLLTYLSDYVLKHDQKQLKVMKIIFIVHVFLVIIVYLTNLMDFFQTVFISQFWLVTAIILVIILLIRDAVIHHNQDAIRFIKAFFVLAVFAAFELIGFALGDFQSTSYFLSIGVAILMIILLIAYIRYVVERMKLSHEKELYERLAFIDHVTQGQNRLSFERDLDGIFNDPHKREKLRLVLFDLDNLKSINDAYGHVEGDKAIKQAFDIITETFKDQGMCYRIGGDEFACLYDSSDELIYEQKKKEIDEKTKIFEDATPYHFGLSYGSALAKTFDTSSKDLIHQADIDMYQHKKNRKSAIEST